MIVLVSGTAHSGKGVVTNTLVEKLGFKEMSFALPIKLWAMNYLGLPVWTVFSSREEAIRAGAIPTFDNITFGKTSESRQILQGLGSMFKEQVDPDFWTKKLMAKLDVSELYEDIAISDWRFPREAEMIAEDYDCPKDPVYKIRVVRPNAPPIEAGAQHKSEVSLTDDMVYDHVFYNVSTRDALEREVEEWARLKKS